jgi:hypothetical protein
MVDLNESGRVVQGVREVRRAFIFPYYDSGIDLIPTIYFKELYRRYTSAVSLWSMRLEHSRSAASYRTLYS